MESALAAIGPQFCPPACGSVPPCVAGAGPSGRWKGVLPPVTIALPVHRPEPDRLARALASIEAQTHADLDVLIIPNGCSPAETLMIRDLAAGDPRCRVEPLPEASLASALNVALRSARHDLVARQDADDLSVPSRIETLAGAMLDRPGLAALGCGWTVLDRETHRTRCTMRPPTDPASARAALLMENPFAHGSMMLRRDAVRAAGGYDESLPRAQDYDLWMRLARRGVISAVPDVLYHWTHHGRAGYASSPEQARAHARLMLRVWRELDAESSAGSERESELQSELEATLARVIAGEARPDALDTLVRGAPSVLALMARLWAQRMAPQDDTAEVCQRARLREVGAQLRAAGVRGVHLFPDGAHAAWVREHQHDLGIEVVGTCDDDPRRGVPSPDEMPAGSDVLICSDTIEATLWDRCEPLRQRGVRVHRLYGEAARQPDATDRTARESPASLFLARTA